MTSETEFCYLNQKVLISKVDGLYMFTINDLIYHFRFEDFEKCVAMAERCVRVNLGFE